VTIAPRLPYILEIARRLCQTRVCGDSVDNCSKAPINSRN
jgi:hypothetical protein